MPDTCKGTKSTEAFEAKLAPILRSAYGAALHMTHNREDAEDLLQETTIRAFRGFDALDENAAFKAWFFRILHNTFINVIRKRQREPDTIHVEDAPDLYLYLRTRDTGLHALSRDPAALVLGKIGHEQVTRAIRSLPEEFRTVSALYFAEQFTYEEIADIVQCPVGTVRSRLHRGRKLLQKTLWHIAEEQGVVASLCAEEDDDA